MRKAKRGQHRMMIRRKTGVRETHRQKKRTFQNTLGQHMDAESKNARTPVNSTTSTGQTDNDTRLRTGDCRCGTLTSWRCFETPFRLTPRRCVSTRTRPHTRETRLWCLVCMCVECVGLYTRVCVCVCVREIYHVRLYTCIYEMKEETISNSGM